MRQNKTIWQMLAREFGAAFGVLAIVFLAFAHQPVYANAPQGSIVDGTFYVAADFCGGGPGDDGTGRAGDSGCEACRIAAGIALPSSCDVALLSPAPSGHTPVIKSCEIRRNHYSSQARAPPCQPISL